MFCAELCVCLCAATKAYVDYFSRSLHYELKGKGVHVQCQVPYFVTSKLSKIRKTSLTTPDPKTYAASALRSTGLGASVVPYPMHAIQHWVISWVFARFFQTDFWLKERS